MTNKGIVGDLPRQSSVIPLGICMVGMVFAAAASGAALFTASAAKVEVDFSREIGPVKPVNGVGQPPLIGKLLTYPMFHYLKDAGIPYSRLHDVGGWLGGGLFVDIPNLFPDFDAAENDPKS